MKIALFMIMCSATANQCMEPHKLSTFNNQYDCLLGGYEESIKKTTEIGKHEINKHQIYIKFVCTPDIKEKKGTGV